ncbi:MAG: ABC transporter ATP-binding protein [Candidatus Ranarchaeia archaeon]
MTKNNQKNSVEIQKLSKSFFQKEEERVLFKDLDFVIPTNSIFSITGPSGSGKTTLLHIIAGIDLPTSGKAMVLGQTPAEMEDDEVSNWRLRNIGFVFQDFNLISTFTAKENITFPLDLLEYDFDLMDKRAEELLDLLGLSELKDKYPNNLSGGEQKRVAIARALSFDPSLLILDEPLGNLDADTRIRIQELLLELKKQNKTIITVSHDKNLQNISDFIYSLENKQIKQLK